MRPSFGHLCFAALIMLPGCQGPGEAGILSQAFMAPELVERPRRLYCYRTLGEPDCHLQPLPGEDSRLIEFYGPPPGLLTY